MAGRALIVWAAAGALLLAGGSAGAASVLNLDQDESLDTAVDASVPPKEIPADPKAAEALVGSWFNEGDEDHGGQADPSIGPEAFLLSSLSEPVPMERPLAKPDDSHPSPRAIALPPGMVTGSVALLLLLGRGLIRRGFQMLR